MYSTLFVSTPKQFLIFFDFRSLTKPRFVILHQNTPWKFLKDGPYSSEHLYHGKRMDQSPVSLKGHANETGFSIFLNINRPGKGPLHTWCNLSDFIFEFEEIFKIKIDSPLSAMQGVVKIVLGTLCFKPLNKPVETLKINYNGTLLKGTLYSPRI